MRQRILKRKKRQENHVVHVPCVRRKLFRLCQGMWCEEYLLAHSSQFKVNWKRSSCRFRIGSWQLLCFLEDTILTSLSFTKDLVGWGSLLPRDVHGNFSSIPQGWQWKDGRMECRRASGRLKQKLWTLSSKKSTWTCYVSRFPTTANRAEQRHQAFIGSLTCRLARSDAMISKQIRDKNKKF